MKTHSRKNDKDKKARQGYTRVFNLACATCGTHCLTYQKDGPGALKRVYLDRIIAPKKLAALQKLHSVKSALPLTCVQCKALLGTPIVYNKETRIAFLLQHGKVKKTGIARDNF